MATLGDAFIGLVPQTREFIARLNAEIKALRAPHVDVHFDPKTEKVDAAIAKIRAQMALLQQKASRLTLDADDKAVTAKIAGLGAQIAGLERKASHLQVDADNKAAIAKIAALELQSARLRDSLDHLTADVEVNAALTKIYALDAQVKVLKSDLAHNEVGMATTAAKAHIDALRAQILKLRDDARIVPELKKKEIDAQVKVLESQLAILTRPRDIPVKLDTGGLSGGIAALGLLGGGIGGIGGLGRAFGFLNTKIALFGGLMKSSISVWHLAALAIIDIGAVWGGAAIAAGAFAVAGSDAAREITQRMQNLHIAADSTRMSMYPLTGALEKLHDAVRPQVFQIFGDALQVAAAHSGEFARLAKGAADVVARLAARATVALSGTGLDIFTRNAVQSLGGLGTAFGNVFGAIGNIINVIPGYAQILLSLGVAFTGILENVTRILEPVIKLGLAFHGAFVYIGLAVTGVVALAGPVSRLGLALIGAASGAWAFVTAEIALISESGLLVAALDLIQRTPVLVWISLAAAAITGIILLFNHATNATKDYTAALIKMADAVPVTQALSANLRAQGDITRRLAAAHRALAGTGSDLVKTFREQSGAMSATSIHTGIQSTEVQRLSASYNEAQQKVDTLTSGQRELQAEYGRLQSRINPLAKQFGGLGAAYGILNAAGITTTQLAKDQGNAWNIDQAQINGTIDAYKAMAGTAGQLNNDLDVLGRTETDQYQATQKLNQAWSTFISDVTGTQGSFDTVAQGFEVLSSHTGDLKLKLGKLKATFSDTGGQIALQGKLATATAGVTTAQGALSKLQKSGTASASQLRAAHERLVAAQDKLTVAQLNLSSAQSGGVAAIDALTPAGIALNQAFSEQVGNIDKLFASWRTAGISNDLFTKGVKAGIAPLVKYATGSTEATAQLIALAQEAGYHGPDSLKALIKWLGNTGDATKTLKQVTNDATITEGLLTGAMQSQGKFIANELLTDINNAIIKYQGVGKAASDYGAAIAQFGRDSAKTLPARNALIDSIIRAGRAAGDSRPQIAAMIAQVLGVPIQTATQLMDRLGGKTLTFGENAKKAAKKVNESFIKTLQQIGFDSPVINSAIGDFSNKIVNLGTGADKTHKARDTLVKDLENAGLSSDTAKAFVKALEAKVVSLGTKMGGTGDAAKTAAKKIDDNFIGSLKKVHVHSPAINKDVKAFADNILASGTNSDKTKKARDTLIKDLENAGLGAKDAKARVKELQDKIDKLKGKNVNINLTTSGSGSIIITGTGINQRRIDTKTGQLRAVGGHTIASGGYISTGAGPTVDDNLAMLARGELVVPAHMVAAGAVDHLRGKLPGFAGGGLIGGAIGQVSAATAAFGAAAVQAFAQAALAAIRRNAGTSGGGGGGGGISAGQVRGLVASAPAIVATTADVRGLAMALAAAGAVARRISVIWAATWRDLRSVTASTGAGIIAETRSVWKAVVPAGVRHAVAVAFDGIRSDTARSTSLTRHDVAAGWGGISAVIAASASRSAHAASTGFSGMQRATAAIMGATRGIVAAAWNSVSAIIAAAASRSAHAASAGFSGMLRAVSAIMSDTRRSVAAAWNSIYAVTATASSRSDHVATAAFTAMLHAVSMLMASTRRDVAAAWSSIYAVTAAAAIKTDHVVTTEFAIMRRSTDATLTGSRRDMAGAWAAIHADTVTQATRTRQDTVTQFLGLRRQSDTIFNGLLHDIRTIFDIKVPAAFQQSVAAIARIWGRVAPVVDNPIKTIVNSYIAPLVNDFINPVLKFVSLGAIQFAIPHLAKGGFIPGFGGGDQVPALLEKGETVVDKMTTKRLAGVFKAAGVPGFATGGPVYGDPLRHAAYSVGRIDQGIDFTGSGPIFAIGPGVITRSTTGSSWPGGGDIIQSVQGANWPGGLFFYAENLKPRVGRGQHVDATTQIADFSGGLEFGFAAPGSTGQTLAWVSGQSCYTGDPGCHPTAYGREAARLMAALRGKGPSVSVLGPILKGLGAGLGFGLTGVPLTIDQIFHSLGKLARFAVDLAHGDVGGATRALTGQLKPATGGAKGEYGQMLGRIGPVLIKDVARWLVKGIKKFVTKQQAASAATGTTGSTGVGPVGSVSGSEKSVIDALLKALGAPSSGPNEASMASWIRHETPWPPVARFNPMNTTLNEPGATSFNSVGVKNYTSWQQGIAANAATILHSGYPTILADLRAGSGIGANAAADLLRWSGGGYSHLAKGGLIGKGKPCTDCAGAAVTAFRGRTAPDSTRTYAGGGFIPGFGGGDQVPALLEKGETVVDKMTTKRLAGVFRAAGVPGFATGGVVARHPKTPRITLPDGTKVWDTVTSLSAEHAVLAKRDAILRMREHALSVQIMSNEKKRAAAIKAHHPHLGLDIALASERRRLAAAVKKDRLLVADLHVINAELKRLGAAQSSAVSAAAKRAAYLAALRRESPAHLAAQERWLNRQIAAVTAAKAVALRRGNANAFFADEKRILALRFTLRDVSQAAADVAKRGALKRLPRVDKALIAIDALLARATQAIGTDYAKGNKAGYLHASQAQSRLGMVRAKLLDAQSLAAMDFTGQTAHFAKPWLPGLTRQLLSASPRKVGKLSSSDMFSLALQAPSDLLTAIYQGDTDALALALRGDAKGLFSFFRQLTEPHPTPGSLAAIALRDANRALHDKRLRGGPQTFDSGGWLMPGTSVVRNNTGAPERVTPGGMGGLTAGERAILAELRQIRHATQVAPREYGRVLSGTAAKGASRGFYGG